MLAMLKLGKPALYALALAGLLALAALGFWRGMAAIDNAQAAAVAVATAAERNHWRAEIEKSNAAVANARAAQAILVAAAETKLARAEADAKAAFDELEKKNAALPVNPECGLSAERGGLLDRIK
ncbi:hypothetical protein [Bosea sp. LjRoot237]|uniref:hypothetical protein n=1 Tax=Bosea sp. LjRoot237 TaxID=3342292 RepID=UPI003ECDFEA6